MLGVKIDKLTRACTPASGGVSRILLFDPNDFEFTQDATTKSYTTVTKRKGAETTGFFVDIPFKRKEAEYKFNQSVGASGAAKYVHEFTCLIASIGQTLTNFLTNLDAASYCSGIGIAIQLNSGEVLIMGEAYVDGDLIPSFWPEHNGSEGGSGKLFDDSNGVTVKITADYSRALNSFSGGFQTLIDMTESQQP